MLLSALICFVGMYAIVRHPMYAGLILASVGLAAISLSEARLALAALLWWILEQKVRRVL